MCHNFEPEFPECNPDEVLVDHNFYLADLWMEQAVEIAALMDEPVLPENWELTAVEPDPAELAEMDANAADLLASLKK